MRRRLPHRGVSLIQCLALISALATITSLSTVLVCRAQRLTTVARSAQDAERDAWHLSADLRREARVATGVRVKDATLTFLKADGAEHAFYFAAEGVTAEQRQDEGRLAGDTYRLHGRPTWGVRFDKVNRLLEVEARFPSETDRARHGATALHVVAATPRLRPTTEAAQ